jgi:hypothetical protein
MQLNVKKLIDDLGGPSRVAAMTGVVRTAPYGWVTRRYIGSRYLEKIKAACPSLDLDAYFEENENGDGQSGTGVSG